MQTVVKKTYQVWYCLFISFRILVCIFFSQLIVGILIGQFQQSERDRHSVVGEVHLAMKETISLLSERQQAELLSRLATVACQLIDQDPGIPASPIARARTNLDETEGHSELNLDETEGHSELELKGIFNSTGIFGREGRTL